MRQLRASDVFLLLSGMAVIVTLSVAQGSYTYDPHHWGLMASNVVDLERGRVPYKEIFIQYGFLTTILHYAFFQISKNIFAIIFGTALLYAIGCAGIYFLTFHFSRKRSLSHYAFLTVILVHPLAIHPWSNYVAFPFITFGCLAVVMGRENWLIGFFGGLLLGAAVLAREGLFLAIAPTVLALVPIHLWCSRQDWRGAAFRLSPLAGFILVLSIFLVGLWRYGLIHFWRQSAVELPKLYSSIFFKEGNIPVWSLVRFVFHSAREGYPRHILFSSIILSALAVWVISLARLRKEDDPAETDLLFVALLTVLLLSSAVHIFDMFRLATGVSLGTGLVYIFVDRFRRGAKLYFVVLAPLLLIGKFGPDAGNYFRPDWTQIREARTADDISLFRGQRWRQDVFDYYRWFLNATKTLEARNCGLRYLKNETEDAFLEAASPFLQYQLMPFGKVFFNIPLDEWSRHLRPDYNLDERLKNHDILIVALQKLGAEEARKPPDGYTLFTRKTIPTNYYQFTRVEALLLAPVECGEAS